MTDVIDKKQRQKTAMTEGPFKKKILLFALPIMLSGFLQLFYSSADLIIVGRFSADYERAQAAVSSTTSLIHLILNLVMGFSVGINVSCARRLGAKNDEGVFKVVHTAVMLGLLSGILVGVVGFFMSGIFLQLMKSPTDVIDLSTTYLKIYFLGAPFILVYEFCASILRAKGETKKPLIYLLISGAINLGLNVIMVVVFKLSVVGVGVATVMSEAVSAFLVVRYLIKCDDACKLHLNKIKIHLKETFEIIKIGVPAGVQGSMFSISNIIIQSSINSFGSAVMAGSGNAASIEGYLNVVVNGVVNGAISFIGQNYGAKKKENIGKVMLDCFMFMTVFCLTSSWLVFLFRTQLLSLFNPKQEIIEAGLPRVIINASTYVLFGYMQLMVGFMRGLGKGVLPMIISICGICVFRVIWVFTILVKFNNIYCLFISYPVSWLLTSLAQGICFLIVKNKTYSKMLTENYANN